MNDHKTQQAPSLYLRWFKNIWLTLTLTAIAIITYCYDYRLVFFMSLGAIAVNAIGLLARLVMSLRGGQKKDRMERLIPVACAIGLPGILLPNIRSIDFACTEVIVWIAEPVLLKQVRRQPTAPFAYHRFNFGRIAGNGRAVVFDESDQVLLPPLQRTEEWWATTREDLEAVQSCSSQARPMFSHFYFYYFGCI